MASALFRLIAAVGRNLVVANTFGSFALLLLFALGGTVLSRGIKHKSSISWIEKGLHRDISFNSKLLDDSSDKIKKWWKWGFWSSPLTYAQNAIVVNEFLGNNWKNVSLYLRNLWHISKHPYVSKETDFGFLPKVVPYTNETLGVFILSSRGFFTEAYWYWIGIGALFGFTILFNSGFMLALAFLKRECL